MLLTDPARREHFRAAYRALAGIAAQPPKTAARLDGLLATIDSERFPGAILPRCATTGPGAAGSTRYYAVAEQLPAWRKLLPLVNAFAGITLTDFDGHLFELRREDPVEALLASHGFEAVAHFGTGDGGTERVAEVALTALERLRDGVERAALPRRAQPRTTGEALQRFRMALATLDRRLAEEQIAFLRSNLRLDALNLHFLEVQLDAAFGDWEGLVRRPFFASLTETRRPPRVTAALVEALYRSAAEPAEAAGGAPAALRRFREDVLPRSGTLFAVLPLDPSPAVGKAFLLALLAVPDARNDARDTGRIEALKTAAGHWPAAEATFFHRLLDLLPSAPAEETTAPLVVESAAPAVAPAAAPELDYRRELELARDASIPATPARARAVLIAATEMDTLDAYRMASEYVERLAPDEHAALQRAPGFRSIWEDVARYAAQGRIPRDWSEWLELLPEMDFAQCRAWAERAVDEWPIERQLRGPDDVRQLMAKIDAVPPAYQDLLFDALPQLVTWIQSDPNWPATGLRPLYSDLLGLLLLGTNRSANVRQAISILLDGVLSLGTTPAEYAVALGGLREYLQQVVATSTVDWILDVVELTVTHGCPEPDARAGLWATAAGLLQPLSPRLTPSQHSVLFELGAVLGVPDSVGPLEPPERPVAQASQTTASRELRNFRMAVYTLTDSVGQNIRNTVARLYPAVRVELLDDHVNSTRLQDLAETVDLFVVFKRSAKHAATIAIQRHRPRGRPTIHAIGKGSSSVLDEIDRHLRELSDE